MKLLTRIKSWCTNPIISETQKRLQEYIRVHNLRKDGLKFKKISKLPFFINNYKGNDYYLIFYSKYELDQQYLHEITAYTITIVDL